MSKNDKKNMTKWNRAAVAVNEAGTKVEFVGGVNRDRIGGNCMVIGHTNEKGETVRAMFDLGSLFTPYESGFTAAYPDVSDYFDRTDPDSGQVTKAIKPTAVLCLTHAHEDHIGALMNYIRMGYELPPIKASGFTRSLIRKAFAQMGMQPPFIEKINPGDRIMIGTDMEIEPFMVSHSVVDAMGFHTLTKVDGKSYAGIINNGDFLVEENMPVGQSFNFETYTDLLKRKLTTNVQIDSTSTVPNGSERIGFEQAVQNTLQVIEANSDRSLIVSPVISRSVENIAIDIAAARKLGTKVYLEGKWLQLVKQAMMDSGHLDFDDVVYRGALDQYLADKGVKRKYVVCTGAFAQGLEEYNHNRSDLSNIPMASATRMALGLHQDIRLGRNVLVLARQRIIDEINGKTGPQMLQMMAAQGAKVVITPCGRQIGDFEQVRMQDSGHINARALGNLVDVIRQHAPEAIFTPIHGNPQQCGHTKQIIEQHGGKVSLAENLEVMKVGRKLAVNEAQPYRPVTWIAVKNIFQNPIKPNPNIPAEGLTEFWRIDDFYMPIEKICEVVNQPITKSPYALRTVSSSQNVLDDTAEDVILDEEPMRLSPKEAKFGGKKKWKKAAAEQAGTGRLSKKEYKKKKALEAIAAYQRSLQADKQNNIQILRARKEKLR